MKTMKATATNLYVLRREFAVADRIPNRIEAVSVPHIKRCIAAGLIVVDGKELALTDAGKAVRS